VSDIAIKLIYLSVVLLCIGRENAAQVREQRSVDANAPGPLIERIEKLERRIAELEAKLETKVAPASTTAAIKPEVHTEPTPASAPLLDGQLSDSRTVDFFRDTTFNVTFDGYYGYSLLGRKQGTW
jgi:hypothetical protein